MNEARTTSHRLVRTIVAVAAIAAVIAIATVDAESSLTVLSRALGRRRPESITNRLSPERIAAIRWALFLGVAAPSAFLWSRPAALWAAPRSLARAARGVVGHVTAWFAALPRAERWAWAALTAIVLAQRVADALIVPMHCDELRTYFEIVSRGPIVALTAYRDSNNHIFHSLLSSAFVASPIPAPLDLRLVSVLASALVPIALAMTLRAAAGAVPAYLGAAALLSLPPVSFYGASARGYALCLLAAALGTMATARLVQRPGAVRARWLFVISCGLGALTVPMHVYCVACLVVVRGAFALADRDARTLVRTAADAALSGIVAAIGYAGAFLWSDLAALTSARYVHPGTVGGIAARLPGYVGRMGSWMFGSGLTGLALPALLVALAVLFWRAPRSDRGQRCLAAVAFAFAASVAVIPMVQRMYPPHRGWIYVCLSLSVCVALAAAQLRARGALRPAVAGLAVLVVLASGVRSTRRSIERNRSDGELARIDDWLSANAVPDVYAASQLAGLSLRYHSLARGHTYSIAVADTWHNAARAFTNVDRSDPPAALVSELDVPLPAALTDYRLAHQVGEFGVWVRQP